MHDTPDTRVWELQVRGGSTESAMVITEAKECSEPTEPEVTLLAESHVGPAGHGVQRYRYRLDKNGCTLDIALPESDSFVEYKQFMLYGILVGQTKRTQLYKAKRK